MFGFLSNYQHMHKILDEEPENNKGALWLGDVTGAFDIQGLKSRNIKTVLTTASGLGVYFNSATDITHK